MDEEVGFMADCVERDASVTDSEDVDSEYEFDACHFFDFCRGETESEAEEAENWFRYAHEYPPSPFILKLKMMKAAKMLPKKVYKTSSRKKEANKKSSTSSNSDSDTDHKAASTEVKVKGVKHHSQVPQDNMRPKSKSIVNVSKPSGSSFMKPTASHLAKQNKECDTHSGGRGRLQKPLLSAGEKLRSPIRSQNQTTKRQKLEYGYLRKAAQLKHGASFLHKIAKKAAQLEGSSNCRVKTTIPKQPALVTEDRDPRHRSQNISKSVQQPKTTTHAVGGLNKKILGVPKLPQSKKSVTRSNEFQRCAGKQNRYGTDSRITKVKT